MFENKIGKIDLKFVKRKRIFNDWDIFKAVVNGKHFTVRMVHFEDPSIYGIDEGRISKLSITDDDDNNKLVVNYDRGWDIRPMTVEEDSLFIQLKKMYN